MPPPETSLPLGAQRSLHWGLAASFALLLLFGGGGMRTAETMLELLCLGWLLLLIWLQARYHLFSREALLPALFLGAVAALPVLQLIPLPYAVWSNLPGREVAVEINRAAGLGEMWRPLSLVPEDTRLSALTLLAPLAIFFGVAALPAEARPSLARPVVGVAILSAGLGALQFIFRGSTALQLSSLADPGQAGGIFTYRNIQADFLLIGILMAAFLGRSGRYRRGRDGGQGPEIERLIAIAAIPVLALMVIATRSRFGALLLVPVLLVSLQVMLSYRLRTNLAVATSVLAGGAGLLYAASPSFLQGTLVRFSAEDRSRTDVLPDLLHALGEFFPAGAGIGTFDPVFRASESLFLVDLTYVHHAHNEYLELAIEGGLPAILLMLVFVAGFAAQAWRVPDLEARDYLLLKRLSAGAILIMLLHSLVDYPLRTITTQALFAFLSAILFLGRRKRQAA